MSTTVAPAQRAGRRSGRTSVRRAASSMLRRTAPWVLLVLLVTSVLGGALSAWAIWVGDRGEGPLALEGDSGVATAVASFVGLAMLVTWMRTVRTAVPVLVSGGVTRRAVTGGVVVAGTALAVVVTALLTVVALVVAPLQHEVARRAALGVGRSSARDAYSSSLTFRHDGPLLVLNPVETLPWLVTAVLAGALLGAARYRWRARGAVGVLVVLGGAWVVYPYVVLGCFVPSRARLVGAAVAGPPGVDVVPCLLLAAALWLVLRRAPLRQGAR